MITASQGWWRSRNKLLGGLDSCVSCEAMEGHMSLEVIRGLSPKSSLEYKGLGGMHKTEVPQMLVKVEEASLLTTLTRGRFLIRHSW